MADKETRNQKMDSPLGLGYFFISSVLSKGSHNSFGIERFIWNRLRSICGGSVSAKDLNQGSVTLERKYFS
jgi:hypothetical protein